MDKLRDWSNLDITSNESLDIIENDICSNTQYELVERFIDPIDNQPTLTFKKNDATIDLILNPPSPFSITLCHWKDGVRSLRVFVYLNDELNESTIYTLFNNFYVKQDIEYINDEYISKVQINVIRYLINVYDTIDDAIEIDKLYDVIDGSHALFEDFDYSIEYDYLVNYVNNVVEMATFHQENVNKHIEIVLKGLLNKLVFSQDAICECIFNKPQMFGQKMTALINEVV